MVELKKESFGKLENGEEIHLYRFRNGHGVEVAITNFGGRIVQVLTPDRQGRTEDIALGFDNLEGYVHKNPYFGALVGRYANRIAYAQFKLDGQTYHLAVNNPPNSLHGGTKGFDKVVWTAEETRGESGPALQLKYRSPDGEDGYPGNLDVTVVYSLRDDNELHLDFTAMTDKKTVLNLTNHSYFDLSGQGKGNILNHVVSIDADRFVPINENLIPTGELAEVAGTPFDFRTPRRVGDRIDEENKQLKLAMGYDHTFVLNRSGDKPSLAARATDPDSGRVLEVSTTQPGVQFYSGNHLDGTVHGKGGVVYGFRMGFCLETQFFPDSPNQPNFPSTELQAGETFRASTIFRFSIAP